MNLKEMMTNSVGRKFVMGFTGIFLIIFLIVHASVNACIFLNDGGVFFNEAAHFMAYNWILRFLELVLFIGLIMHAIQGLLLWKMNRKARPVKYQVTHYTKKIKWYSRSMGILGTLVLLYLVMHLSHFWIGTKDQLYGDHIQRNLYQEMKEVFTNPIWFTLYMVGLASLLFHLLHGFKSAFQSLGINDRSWTPLIEKIGVAYSIIIILVFAMMPISFMAGWLK